MKKNATENKVAKKLTSVLNGVLRAEANTATCVLAYQPKAPKNLKRFKNSK